MSNKQEPSYPNTPIVLRNQFLGRVLTEEEKRELDEWCRVNLHGEKPKPGCMDCNVAYADGGWCDVVIPNQIWKAIAPDDGLLCFPCMTKRLICGGFENVPVAIRSGPYQMQELEPAPAPTGAEISPPVCAIHHALMELHFYARGPNDPVGNHWLCPKCGDKPAPEPASVHPFDNAEIQDGPSFAPASASGDEFEDRSRGVSTPQMVPDHGKTATPLQMEEFQASLPRCEKMDGSTLRIIPSYTEAGWFKEANCVLIADKTGRQAIYIPLKHAPVPSTTNMRDVVRELITQIRYLHSDWCATDEQLPVSSWKVVMDAADEVEAALLITEDKRESHEE